MTAPMNPDRTDVLGRRIAAALVDLLLMIVLAFVWGALFGESEADDGTVSFGLQGGAFLSYVLVTLLYYGGLEATTGQTIGKRLLGVRVAKLDGSKPGAGAIVARTLLRVIDGLFFYLVGLVAVLATGQRRQRIGDLAGGTTVVSASEAPWPAAPPPGAAPPPPPPPAP